MTATMGITGNLKRLHHGGWDGWPRLHGGCEGVSKEIYMKFRKTERKRGLKGQMSKEGTRRKNASRPLPRNDSDHG